MQGRRHVADGPAACRPPVREVDPMSGKNPLVLLGGGLVAFWLLNLLLPFWLVLLLVVGIPVAGYLMLDPSQRRRLLRTGRKQLGR